MPDLGPAELIIVLLVVVMIFGGTRLAEIGGSLGKGIKEFKKAVSEEDEPEATTEALPPATSVSSLRCPECDTENTAAARFCAECGASLVANDAHVTA
jgi:sec-independent protein translocase protein TatA